MNAADQGKARLEQQHFVFNAVGTEDGRQLALLRFFYGRHTRPKRKRGPFLARAF